MRHSTAALVLLALAGSADPAASQTPVSVRRLFQLEPTSEFQRGCFEMCACPITLVRDVRGGFALTAAGREEEFAVFDVTGLSWTMRLGETLWQVTGEGRYRVDARNELQRLELDLRIEDEPVEHFDSGIVATDTRFPSLDVTISVNDMLCYDTVFLVRAAPLRLPVAPVLELLPGGGALASPRTSWGTLKALFRR